MRIAVPTENDSIAQNMGRCLTFTLVDAQDDGIQTRETVTLEREGNISVVTMLAERKVDTLICGELGLMTRSAMQMIEIELVPGCTGSVDTAIENYLAGKAQGDPSILAVEIVMDENDPMQCMKDCASCHGCHTDTKNLQELKEHIKLDEVK